MSVSAASKPTSSASDASAATSLTPLPVPAAAFDLEATLACGQVFHWSREGAGWLGVIGTEAVYVERRGEALLVPAGREEMVARYFALDHPLEEIRASFPTDPAMTHAAAFCVGMRLVRQPAWECLATFISSSMKQVTHFAQMSHAIRRNFGEPVEWNGKTLFSYPSPERLALASEEALRGCGLGFRAKNLLGTARMVAEGTVDLARVSRLDDDAARAELCRLPGVGIKVA
ncbi:MAG: DNA glycosylase, partial [Verrucomicrobiota bacterium]